VSAAALQAKSPVAPSTCAPEGHLLTAVLDVAGAAVKGAAQALSDVLSVLAATYADSDDEGQKKQVIDVDGASLCAEEQHMQMLHVVKPHLHLSTCCKWTGRFYNVNTREKIVMPGPIICRIHSMLKDKRAYLLSQAFLRMRNRERERRVMKWRRRRRRLRRRRRRRNRVCGGGGGGGTGSH
jgi:hypothetical protein